MKIFYSKTLLNYENNNLNNVYTDKQYYLKKNLIILVISSIISFLNYIISFKEDNVDYYPTKNGKNLSLALMTLNSCMVLLTPIVSCKFSKKNNNRFNYVVSVFLYSNIILNTKILSTNLSNSEEILIYNYYFKVLSFLIILMAIAFVECNYISFFISNFVSGLIILMNKLDGIHSLDWCAILSYCLEMLVFSIFVYFSEKRNKILLFYKDKAKTASTISNESLEIINSALIVLDPNKVYYNNKFKSYLQLSEDEEVNREIINSFLSGGFEDFNFRVEQDLKDIFNSNFENLDEKIEKLLIFLADNCKYKEINYIATKHLGDSENQQAFAIYLRYNLSGHIEIYLKNEILLHDVEDIKLSERYKKMFLNKFSHEFKNPLLNIIGLLQNIKSRLKDNLAIEKKSTFRKYFTNVSNVTSSEASASFRRMPSIGLGTNQNSQIENKIDLKNFSHIKNLHNYMINLIGDFDFLSNSNITISKSDLSKKFLSEASVFSIEKIIKSCIKIFETRSELNDKNITFTYEVDADVPKINSDFRRVNQIFLNLISNAFKFTSNGEISIKVKNLNESPEVINVSISDTGTGFSKELLSKYNEDVVDDSINTKHKQNQNNIYGIGLGLNIVKLLVSLLGRKFKIESNPRDGSRISFQLFKNIKKNDKIISDDRQHSICLVRKQTNMERKFSTFQVEKVQRFFTKVPVVRKSSETLERLQNKINNQFKLVDQQNQIHVNTFNTNEKRKSLFMNSNSLEFLENPESCNDSNLGLIKSLSKEDLKLKNTVILTNLNMNISENLKMDAAYDNSQDEIEFSKNLSFRNDSDKKESLNESSRDCASARNESVAMQPPLNYQIFLNDNSRDQIEISFASEKELPLIRILLVEDEKLIRTSELKILKKFFQNLNRPVEITECTDGVEGLYYIFKGIQKRIKYDYIITDETMNFMRGSLMVQTLRSLFADNLMYSVNIYMLTSYESSTIIEKFGNIVDGIVTKPLTKENVTNIFGQIL